MRQGRQTFPTSKKATATLEPSTLLIEEIIARNALLLPLFHEQAYRFARPGVNAP